MESAFRVARAPRGGCEFLVVFPRRTPLSREHMTPSTLRIASLLIMSAAIFWGTTVQAQTTQKQWRLVREAVKEGGKGPAQYKLQLADAPVRQPGAGEVLIKMHAASLNRRDVAVMKAQYPMPPR